MFVRILRDLRVNGIFSDEDIKAYGKNIASARINAAREVSGGGNTLGSSALPGTIRNTPELRECIKDAMMRRGITSSDDLNRLIGYDSAHSLDRLLAGKLNFFPDVLSVILDKLEISHDDAPMSASERALLASEGIFNSGAVLIRPIPVVDWCNAAGHLGLISGGGTTMTRWNPDTTETIAAPVGARKDTQAFRVAGQSMEPKIYDNDVLFCEPRYELEDIPNNKIVIVKFSGNSKMEDVVVCKRYRRFGEKILLSSDNPSGRDFEIEPRDIAWIGVVTSKHSVL